LPNKESIQFNTLVKGKSEFYSDSLNIKTIVSNLVSNAIKFQDPNKKENKIDIEIDTDISTVKINIKDNGVGIPESSKEKIFDMFYRSTYSGKGSGLGLYIVKETVDKLGGKITFDSEENKGTVFSVVVPNLLEIEPNINQ
jgi:signal transduction histidine kinase